MAIQREILRYCPNKLRLAALKVLRFILYRYLGSQRKGMIIDMNRKILSIFLVLMISFLSTSPAYASEADATHFSADTYAEYMANIADSNTELVEVLDYVSDENGNLPDYYGGTGYDENGNLIVYLTTFEESASQTLIDEFPSLSYQLVSFSINDLIAYRDAFLELGITFEKLAINPHSNRVDIYFGAQEDLIYASALPNNGLSKDAYNFFLYESADQMFENTWALNPEKYYSTEEIAAYEQNTKNACSSFETTSTNASVSIKPGSGYAVASGGSPVGTIGVCAILNSGSYVMITHGHNLSAGTSIYLGSTKIGTVTKQYHNSSYIGYDFSYTKVSSSYVSSSLAGNYGSLTKTYSESQLISMGTVNGYFIGNSSGSATRYSTSILMTTSGSGSTYPYLTLGTGTAYGDSGGPIYMVSSSQTVFLGIVKGNSGGSGTGVPASTIKSTVGLYYYFN